MVELWEIAILYRIESSCMLLEYVKLLFEH